MAKTLVIALGGNAFLRKGQPKTVDHQWKNVMLAAKQIVDIYMKGYRIVVTHGNGPQVGMIMEWMESLKDRYPPLTMDIATAMTQGWLGYMLMQSIGNELESRGVDRKVVSIVNQVLVDKDDPAFSNPTKFIGGYYSREEAEMLSKEKGWIMKPDPRGGYRRVVPSPTPIRNIEREAITRLLEEEYIVIASGGGGVPVVEENGILRGVEAVIDKDLASSILAQNISADGLVIATDVEGVYLDYGTSKQRIIRRISVDELEKLYEEGLFPPGSMGPKVRACIEFVKRTGKWAVIGSLENLEEAITGDAGTYIYADRSGSSVP
ncbi:MAG: carbamate kinase [Desulfurococcales archaeon]|nr:carbamate kinase [Desulfurococcales archaeon]